MKYKIDYDADIVLVTGDRNYKSHYIVESRLAKFKNIKLLIHGDAKGADTIAKFWAKYSEVPYLSVPAQWTKQGRAAGPIRNSAMLAWITIVLGRPLPEDTPAFKVQVIAFHKNIADSKGTKDMMDKANKAGYNVYLVKD